MRLMKIRQNHSIIIHPKAMPAAKFCQLLPFLFTKPYCQKSLRFDFDATVTKVVLCGSNVGSSAGVLAAFSPIPLLVQATPTPESFINEVGCFKETSIELDDIEFQAWTSVFIRLKTSVDSTSNLYQIWEMLNKHVPKHVLEKYFGKQKISQQMLAEITNNSLSTIKHGIPVKKVVSEDFFDGYDGIAGLLSIYSKE